VLVIVGHSAPEHVRKEAWVIPDSLRFDPRATADWRASP
jgi:hypothetical protein